MKIKLSELNACSADQFVAVCGPFFERSPWIAAATGDQRPFGSRRELHQALCQAVDKATEHEQIQLVRAHPDLAGRAHLDDELTSESHGEQAAAGLNDLSTEELRHFREFNSAYRSKFGFPFVICARENKKGAILSAFPVRLQYSPERELRTALDEIAKIAWLRLCDTIEEA